MFDQYISSSVVENLTIKNKNKNNLDASSMNINKIANENIIYKKQIRSNLTNMHINLGNSNHNITNLTHKINSALYICVEITLLPLGIFCNIFCTVLLIRISGSCPLSIWFIV